MENEESTEKLQTLLSESVENNIDIIDKKVKFLIFSLNNVKFAVHAEMVKEIVLDTDVFFTPFVPGYVRGFINRHGEPYTVVDINVLLGKDPTVAKIFLIFNIEDDQIAGIISDVVEIINISETLIDYHKKNNEEEKFFAGAFKQMDSDIFIINVQNILSFLDDELEDTD